MTLNKKEEIKDETVEAPQEKVISLNELQTGYLVAINQEGNFIFELIGQKKGIVENLGLHKLAEKRLLDLLNQKQGGGDALVNEVGHIVLNLSSKIDKVFNKLFPKPDNEIE